MATKKTETKIGEVVDSTGNIHTGEPNEGETAGFDIEAVRAEIAKMLADAQAEANKIIEEAKASVKGRERGAMDEKLREEMEEYVEVRLFKDNNKYKDDVVVGVNGEFCLIQRGVPVKIKRKFAEVLDASAHQDYETSVMMEKKQADSRAKGI